MQMKIAITILLLSVSFCYNLFSKDKKDQIELPDYSVFMDAQLRCDNNKLNKLPWDKKYRDTTKMAYKVWTILSDISLKEEKREIKKRSSKHRDFVLVYTGLVVLYCGQESHISDNPEGDKFITLPVIKKAFERPGFIDVVDDDNPPHEGLTYIYEFGYTDSPNEPGMEGNTCIVRLEDFLKAPLASIDLKKLCKGESKKKIEFTKKEILRVAEILKTRMRKNNSVHTRENGSKNNK
jgi:hypothetical protein